MTKVYVCKFEESKKDILSDKMSLLAYEDRKRIERYKNEKDRLMSFLGFAMFVCFADSCDDTKDILTILSDYSFITPDNMNKDYVISVNESGKPYVKGRNDLWFNISHSGDYAVCAISDEEIGIDVQEYRKINSSIAERFFSLQDIEYINKASGDREKNIIDVWTVKEAYAKLDGRGLSIGLDSFYGDFTKMTVFDTKNQQKISRFYKVEFDISYACYYAKAK